MKTSLVLPAWIGWTLRLGLAAIFIYAGVTKMSSPSRFAADIHNFRLLPWMVIVPLAFYLPWLELLCGAALLLPRVNRGSAVVLLLLALVFVIALTSARIRGIDISCGCFGHAARNLGFTSHLSLDLAIIVALLVLLRATISATPTELPN